MVAEHSESVLGLCPLSISNCWACPPVTESIRYESLPSGESIHCLQRQGVAEGTECICCQGSFSCEDNDLFSRKGSSVCGQNNKIKTSFRTCVINVSYYPAVVYHTLSRMVKPTHTSSNLKDSFLLLP